MHTDNRPIEEQWRLLRASYAGELPGKLQQIEDGWNELLKAPGPGPALDLLLRRVHSLVGSGATYGFEAISAEARRLEEALRAAFGGSGPPAATQYPRIGAAMAALRQAAAVPSESMPPVAGEAARRAGLHVLVVDDDPDITRLLRSWLAGQGHTVASVDSGSAGLARLEAEIPDLLFLDILMPDLSGLEVLDRVRARGLDLAVIMITAFGSEQVAVDALRRGADDYLRKPFEAAEFQAVLERTATRLELSRQNAALRRQLDDKRRQLEIELARAGELQAALLPRAVPPLPGFELAARCIPALEVGGDCYDWQLIGPDRLALSLGDVSGKGMPAALLMATTRSALRAVGQSPSPADVLARVAATLEPDLAHLQQFVTLFLGHLDAATRRLVYVDAGHGHVFVRRACGCVEQLPERGLPLGVVPDEVYREGEISFAPGDTLVLYSDGLIDARPGRMLDQQALADALAGTMSAEAMVERLLGLAAAPSLPDDLTIVALHCRED